MPLLGLPPQQWQHWQLSDVEEALSHVAAVTINIVTPIFERRDTTTSAYSGRTPAENSNLQTIAIALGAGIPLGCAVVVLYLLHRRHLKRQRLEDLNDPHKSLDFGMNPNFGGKKNKGGPEMSSKDFDPRSRHMRGLSMEDMGSPYILPRELNGSRASLHSMSRSLRDENDPYRPVTMVKNDWESIRAPRHPNGSMYSAAGSLQSTMTNEKAGLVSHASPMSLSHPKRGDSVSPNPLRQEESTRSLKSADRKPIPARKDSPDSTEKSLPPITPSRGVSLASTSLGDFIPPPPPPPPKDEPEPARPPRTSSMSKGSVHRPQRKDSIAKHPVPAIVEPFPEDLPPPPTENKIVDRSLDHDNFHPPPPPVPQSEPEYDDYSLAMPQPQNHRMSILGLRPLPADLPEDNPEVRANRIRSFYKEYFDESKPNPKGGYVDDYDADYLADYAVYDHQAGGFLSGNRPYAEPVQRRAMTPPPRGPGGSYGFGPGPHRRHMSTQSGAGAYGPRGRAASAPKKRMPPPNTLISLPTPHRLKDDTAIFSAADFAPQLTFRDKQAGRAPDSPFGTPRPYSPNVMAHSPLMKSYDELPVVPSPHMLRKSGTFTSLDFAPPSRLRVEGTASDAGSIRSNRSGISAIQQHAIRGGAYRVSRIPTDMVTTKAALSNQLKPRWDMRNGNNIMG